MERKDAVALLKEISVTCESFRFAQSVSITFDKKKGCVLNVNWTPDSSENEALSKILNNYYAEAVMANGRTVISSL